FFSSAIFAHIIAISFESNVLKIPIKESIKKHRKATKDAKKVKNLMQYNRIIRKKLCGLCNSTVNKSKTSI
ncbi:MAG TPA: hypothetical protein QF423_02655, partial [Candidatus Scalindua sp.]|nr:hypothetical protein [Candidatus Scalindua sp.]